ERHNARQKLAQVVEFCQLQSCRRKYILGYFGEEWGTENCGGCDFCLVPKEEFDATIIAQKILSAVIRTEQRFGINYVSAVLRGANTKAIRQRGHYKLSVYGIAEEFSDGELKEIAGLLVAEGLLFKSSGKYPTLRVTKAGRLFLKNREMLALARPKREDEKESTASRAALDYDRALFSVLRGLRSSLAAEQDVPPYVIFGDVTLQQMAYYFPQSRNSLGRISGVGARKLEQLGDAFLAAIVDYATSHDLKERLIPARKRSKSDRGKGLSTTYVQTRQLLQQGMSIKEIARERGLAESTIAGHLNRLVRAGEKLDLGPLLPPQERYDKIRAALVETGGEYLSPAKEVLGDEYSYDEIRMVWFYMRQQVHSSEQTEPNS
ncbi:MAG: RQC domain-containing protein, partial [Caldilineaceae bacterium]|nr:RQC domain-containing protein [Caldilineaceae bacterium]